VQLPSAERLASSPAALTRAHLAGWSSVCAPKEVIRWLRCGYALPWAGAPPAPFDHGVSLGRLTPEEEACKLALAQQLFDCGAWEMGTSTQYVSQARLVPKPGQPGKWRLIVDLRWINLHLRQSRFCYESLKALHHLAAPGDWMFSMDLEDGFYAIPVAPADRPFLTLDVAGVGLVQFAALPMGLSSSPLVFTKTMRAFVQACRAPMELLRRSAAHAHAPPTSASPSPASGRWLPPHRRSATLLRDLLPRWRAVMTQGVRVLHYVDDFLFLARSQDAALEARGYVEALMSLLGLKRKLEKGCWEPTQRLSPHLGLGLDTVAGQFFVPPARLHKLQNIALALLGRAARNTGLVPRRLLASFCGFVQSLFLALPAARFFLRSLHDALNSVKDSWSREVRLCRQAKTDLRFFAELPSRCNGRCMFRRPETATLHCDASELAWGGVLNLHSPCPRSARGGWQAEQMPEHITSKELRAVLYTVETFLPALRGRRVLLWEDNQAVGYILASWTSRSPLLMATLRRLWWLLDHADISLLPAYIRSASNVWADTLSRAVDTDDWRLSQPTFAQLDSTWGPHTVDRFASRLNSKLPRYNSRWEDPGSAGLDAFSQPLEDWVRANNFCFPPVAALPRLAHLLRVTGAPATVVAPAWPAQAWFQALQELAEGRILHLPRGACLSPPLEQGRSPALAGRVSDWDLVAFRVEARLVPRSPQELSSAGPTQAARSPGTVHTSAANSATRCSQRSWHSLPPRPCR
jgi:hypothetical protein